MSLRDNLEFLRRTEQAFSRAGVVSARAEAETLALYFTKASRIDFFTGKRTLSAAGRRSASRAVSRRVSGVPLSQVLKQAPFRGMTFFVDRHVLTPRPETELLAEKVLEELPPPARAGSGPEILDLGTGTGCLAVALTTERPDCRMTALDISTPALKVARKNIDFHGLKGRIRVLRSDLFSVFGKKRALFDIIVSNPPYIPSGDLPALPPEVRKHEPRKALDGGADGLRTVERILRESAGRLKKGGKLLLEIGDGQSRALKDLAEKLGWGGVRFTKDFNGIDRVFFAERNQD